MSLVVAKGQVQVPFSTLVSQSALCVGDLAVKSRLSTNEVSVASARLA